MPAPQNTAVFDSFIPPPMSAMTSGMLGILLIGFDSSCGSSIALQMHGDLRLAYVGPGVGIFSSHCSGSFLIRSVRVVLLVTEWLTAGLTSADVAALVLAVTPRARDDLVVTPPVQSSRNNPLREV